MRRWTAGVLAALLIGSVADRPRAAVQAPAAVSAPSLDWARPEQEAFLLKAKLVKVRGASKGITGTSRATLSDGTVTHDASVQTIDDTKTSFQTRAGVEFDFRDSWKFNLAAYALDKMLDLNMIPATVERDFQNRDGSFTWWLDDVMMDEGQRIKKKVQPPNGMAWNYQMWVVRVFDQLIANTDRNAGNLLITPTWQIWMIDHSRAFRRHKTVLKPGDLARCDRTLLKKLRELDPGAVTRALSRYLMPAEIEGLLARRDVIVAHFERAGETALYDLKRMP